MKEGSHAEFPCFHVPEPRRAILAAGQKGLAVGAERRRTDATGMREGLAEGRPGRQVPQLCRATGAAGDKGLAVGAERPGIDRARIVEWVGREASRSMRPRAVPFDLRSPVMIVLPSGLNATTLTWFSCWSGCPMGFPVAASQSRAVLS